MRRLDAGNRAPSSAGGTVTRSLASRRGPPGHSGRPSGSVTPGGSAVFSSWKASSTSSYGRFCDGAQAGGGNSPPLLHVDTRG